MGACTANEGGTMPKSTDLGSRLLQTRLHSLELAAPLSAEDMVVQAMDDASPTKWHLGHVTWFFETFILAKYLDGYRRFDERFGYIFNSYYESFGARQPRGLRGLLTRPSTSEVVAYRQHVDDGLAELFDRDLATRPEVGTLIELGIQHEQQHQELLLTDILALFAANPLRPAYVPPEKSEHAADVDPPQWISFEGGIQQVGHRGNGFAWDNEAPRHEVLVHPFRMADRLVTNAEWLAFMADGGYHTATLWLADGWPTVNREGWTAPLYWEQRDGEWHQMSLQGLQPVRKAEPVVHVSYLEADAFARWAGQRLPTEFEWEHAAGSIAQSEASRPRALRPRLLSAQPTPKGKMHQTYGEVWQWTQSAYLPYPGYRPPTGAIGEYNGKFMVGQHVLRGSSCATPEGHARRTYRNFFYPQQRWQFMGLRLAQEVS